MGTTTKTTIYWSLLNHDSWKLHIAATDNGLCYIGSQNKPFAELDVWVKKRFANGELVQDDRRLQPYMAELIAYLQGELTSFTIPFDFYGTAFQLSVWHAMCEVPYGQTASYTDIANKLNRPDAVRAVGTAIGANPILISVPCHRIIGKNGALTGYRGGLEMKVQLLELEKGQVAVEE